MERVTFLIERTGERISCLLNPEALEARRTAGIARRRSAGGALLAAPAGDDPLLPTGGGVTEYDLRLLFDIDVANEGRAPPARTPALPPGAADAEQGPQTSPPALQPPPPVLDVRSLTQPLWALAETGMPIDGALALQRVRVIWGRSWNVPGVITAVAERLERFTTEGVPQRSWLSLRLRRVPDDGAASAPPPSPITPQFEHRDGAGPAAAPEDETIVVPVDEDGFILERLDQIAADHYGDPALARLLGAYNGLEDLLRLAEGQALRLPSRRTLLALAGAEARA
ncbi:hypothetical protein FHS79_002258 [Polymorphobacter multimanifer]|uniref:Uncharacterized protein n=1 Tax=Polymorphobacter multimanifer TaxID=1070431 RepID=A0A841LAT2_9SPHN|nr:hypothetical protein [Polymorphobacter multimanifer]MBB6228073.1 hypothetical protein [Polymorphobacter multimanifer]